MSFTGSSWFGGGIPFEGILDTIAATTIQATSLRRLTGTSWGTNDPIIRIRRSSDDDEADFSYDDTNIFTGNSLSFNSASGTTNGIDYTTWIGVDDAFVVCWYSQINSDFDMLQTSNTAQPKLIGQQIYADGTNDFLKTRNSANYTDTNTHTQFYVGYFHTNSTTYADPLIGGYAAGIQTMCLFNKNLYLQYDTIANYGLIGNLSAKSLVSYQANSTAQKARINNGSWVNFTTASANSKFGRYFIRYNSTIFAKGVLYENIQFNAVIDSADEAAVKTNMLTYYGL